MKPRFRLKYSTPIIALLFALTITTTSLSQQKFEQESRITDDDLPLFAIQFEEGFSDSQRMRWYLERGFHGKSYEAKYKRNGKKFSVEFDTLGTIEDVEIRMNYSSLSNEVRDNIDTQFETDSEKYSISKVQIQYTGGASSLQKVAKNGNYEESCVIRYEIVVRMKQDKKLRSFEYLFDDKGILIQKVEIVIQTSSNLEY